MNVLVNKFATANSLVSQLSYMHRYAQLAEKLESPLKRGLLIISTDVDVGSPEIAKINNGKRDKDVNLVLSEHQIGTIEELAIPLIMKVFDDFEIPITIAVRGQLTEVNSLAMESILDSRLKHDIGAHGYYHRMFTRLTHEEAEEELSMLSSGLKKYGLVPKTFIFPRNQVDHLNLLEKFKYTCYRGKCFVGEKRRVENSNFLEKTGDLYNISPCIFIGDQKLNPFILNRMLDESIKRNLPFHVWFHFWNFGEKEKTISNSITRILLPFLLHAKQKNENGLLEFETMLSATRKVK